MNEEPLYVRLHREARNQTSSEKDMNQIHSPQDFSSEFHKNLILVLSRDPSLSNGAAGKRVGIRPESVRKLRRSYVAAGLVPSRTI